jgi:WD40 repeat protein/transcriptional regulator with XRE-family HTH domain
MTQMGDPLSSGGARGIETREQFAAELTALRLRAGLSIRALAQLLGTPPATVGDYCSGRHLPGPGQQELFTAMLRACGVEDSGFEAWLETVSRLRAASDGRMRRGADPYPGLVPFEIEDRERFFGREETTRALVDRLRAQDAGSSSRGIILLIGPSGAGKSSLLRAGVQARVQEGALGGGDWASALMTPGDQPTETLRACLAELPEHHRVVIIDQFEELFASPAELQDRFVRELDELALAGTHVLVGMRADFYEQALRIPELLAVMRDGPVLLAPMSEEELRHAITGPARSVGAQVEDGLVELLISDLAPREAAGFAHDAGSLPLLSHALLQSWQRARGNRLTVADYRATGGLHGAVSQTAEELYTQLADDQQELARRIFMRLVRMPEDGTAVRRRAARQELDALGDTESQDSDSGRTRVDDVIDRFVGARLITVDVASVELSHEAVLIAWPRLAGWLEDNRAGLRLHRQLTDAANDWSSADRDSALLLRGARLQVIGEWAAEADHRAELNTNERALLAASHEQVLIEQRATRRRSRQMRALIIASLGFAIAALILAAVTLQADRAATHARDAARSRQLALQARSLAPTEPDLAMQLAVLARKVSPTTDATSALVDASSGELPTRLVGPNGPTYLSSSASAGRLAVAYSAADDIRIYGLAGSVPKLLATVPAGPRSAQVFAIALSPDGKLLAAGGSDAQVTVWSLARPTDPTRLATLTGLAPTVYGLSFSADGSQLAAVSDDDTVHLWALHGTAAPRPEQSLTGPKHAKLHGVAFAPSGDQLAAASASGQVLVWPSTGPGAKPVSPSAVGTVLSELAFSPDGHTLVAGGQDSPVYRWTLHGAAPPTALKPLTGFSSWVDSLGFSPDGRYLVAGGSDNTLRVWPTDGTAQPVTLGHPAAVTGVAFGDRGQRLFSADAAGTLRVWSFPPPAALSATGEVFGLDYTSTGDELAVISSGPAGSTQLWRTAAGQQPTLITNVQDPASFGAVAGAGALSANGKLLAVTNRNAAVQLFNVSDPHHPQVLGAPLTGATPLLEQMTFDPRGQLLATGDDAGHVHLWDLTQPAKPISEPTIDVSGPGESVLGVAFSPNAKMLATASTDGHVKLWDVSSPARPQALATAGHIAGYAYTVAFTPDGHTLISGGADRTVRLWNVSDPTHPRALGRPLTGPTSSIYEVAVNPNGMMLAAATTDGSVWVWNIADRAAPKLVAHLTGAASELFSVGFQPNTNTLVAAGADQILHMWNDDPSTLAKTICKIAGTPLTRSEWNQYVQAGQYSPPCPAIR